MEYAERTDTDFEPKAASHPAEEVGVPVDYHEAPQINTYEPPVTAPAEMPRYDGIELDMADILEAEIYTPEEDATVLVEKVLPQIIQKTVGAVAVPLVESVIEATPEEILLTTEQEAAPLPPQLLEMVTADMTQNGMFASMWKEATHDGAVLPTIPADQSGYSYFGVPLIHLWSADGISPAIKKTASTWFGAVQIAYTSMKVNGDERVLSPVDVPSDLFETRDTPVIWVPELVPLALAPYPVTIAAELKRAGSTDLVSTLSDQEKMEKGLSEVVDSMRIPRISLVTPELETAVRKLSGDNSKHLSADVIAEQAGRVMRTHGIDLEEQMATRVLGGLFQHESYPALHKVLTGEDLTEIDATTKSRLSHLASTGNYPAQRLLDALAANTSITVAEMKLLVHSIVESGNNKSAGLTEQEQEALRNLDSGIQESYPLYATRRTSGPLSPNIGMIASVLQKPRQKNLLGSELISESFPEIIQYTDGVRTVVKTGMRYLQHPMLSLVNGVGRLVMSQADLALTHNADPTTEFGRVILQNAAVNTALLLQAAGVEIDVDAIQGNSLNEILEKSNAELEAQGLQPETIWLQAEKARLMNRIADMDKEEVGEVGAFYRGITDRPVPDSNEKVHIPNMSQVQKLTEISEGMGRGGCPEVAESAIANNQALEEYRDTVNDQFQLEEFAAHINTLGFKEPVHTQLAEDMYMSMTQGKKMVSFVYGSSGSGKGEATRIIAAEAVQMANKAKGIQILNRAGEEIDLRKICVIEQAMPNMGAGSFRGITTEELLGSVYGKLLEEGVPSEQAMRYAKELTIVLVLDEGDKLKPAIQPNGQADQGGDQLSQWAGYMSNSILDITDTSGREVTARYTPSRGNTVSWRQDARNVHVVLTGSLSNHRLSIFSKMNEGEKLDRVLDGEPNVPIEDVSSDALSLVLSEELVKRMQGRIYGMPHMDTDTLMNMTRSPYKGTYSQWFDAIRKAKPILEEIVIVGHSEVQSSMRQYLDTNGASLQLRAIDDLGGIKVQKEIVRAIQKKDRLKIRTMQINGKTTLILHPSIFTGAPAAKPVDEYSLREDTYSQSQWKEEVEQKWGRRKKARKDKKK